MAEWSGALISPPAICRLRVRFPSPLAHATLPTTGASVNRCISNDHGCDLYDKYTVHMARKLIFVSRPALKMPIIIIKFVPLRHHTTLRTSKQAQPAKRTIPPPRQQTPGRRAGISAGGDLELLLFSSVTIGDPMN